MEFERIAQLVVRGLDAVEDHVHDAEQVAERLELDAVEGAVVQAVEVIAAEVAGLRLNVGGGLGMKAGAAEARIVDTVAKPGPRDLHHGADDVPRAVEFARIPGGVGGDLLE